MALQAELDVLREEHLNALRREADNQVCVLTSILHTKYILVFLYVLYFIISLLSDVLFSITLN